MYEQFLEYSPIFDFCHLQFLFVRHDKSEFSDDAREYVVDLVLEIYYTHESSIKEVHLTP